MLLYHGSRNKFTEFDPAFYHCGEGVGDYKGWHFCTAPKGALHHCKTYLKCLPYGERGYIYCCEIEENYLDVDIDGCFTEYQYGRPTYGVKLRDSHQIKIVDIVAANQVFIKIYGDPSNQKNEVKN